MASVKKEDALKKVQESVDSFAILGDSTLKSAANGSAAKTAGKDNAAASSDGNASADGNAAASTDGAADGTTAAGGSTAADGSAASDGSSTSDGSSDGTASTDSSSSGAIVNGGFTDEQLGNTDETRTIYRNSDGKPRVIVPDGNGAWITKETVSPSLLSMTVMYTKRMEQASTGTVRLQTYTICLYSKAWSSRRFG